MSDWRPAASAQLLKLRADLLTKTRKFFSDRDVMEVDTPVLGRSTAFDLHLSSIKTRLSFDDSTPYYLQTSPEAFMKRLLAAGSASIYQFARTFRDGEAGRLHNPEFVMLEWYRTGIDLAAMMDEVDELVAHLLGDPSPAVRMSFRRALELHAGVDPFSASLEDLSAACRRSGLSGPVANRGEGLDLLLTHCVQPAIAGQKTFLFDFPAEQAAMAKVRPEDPPVASRFELFIHGIEIANGYDELNEAGEQARRMAADAALRRQSALPVPEKDRHLLDALEHGLPPCCGVALGFDRLVMLAAGLDDVRSVMPFPIDRA